MSDFQVLYNGKGSAVRLPDLDKTEKALSRSAELQIKGEEMKLAKSLKDKEQLIENMKTVPLSIQNDILMTRQAHEIEKFKNTGAALYQKHGLDLPVTAQLELAKAKGELEMKQNTWQAQAEVAKKVMSVLERDKGRDYDYKVGVDRYKKWLVDPENNPFDETALSIAPKSIKPWLRAQSQTMGAKTEPILVNGRWVDQKIVSDEAKKNMVFEGLSDEAMMKQTIADFDEWTKSAPQDKVLALLDSNKDGILSAEERAMASSESRLKSNPIVQWAMNNEDYLNQMTQDEGASKNIPNANGTTFNWTSVHGGNNRNGEFDVLENQPFGKFTFGSLLQLGGVPNSAKTMKVGTYTDLNTGKTVNLNQSRTFQTIGYSPDKDMVIIRWKGDNPYAPDVTAGVSGADFDEFLKKKPFGIDRASLMKNNTQTPATAKPTFLEWKKIAGNENKTFTDYTNAK